MEGKCRACGKEVFFVKEAKYDGFTRVGDVMRCTECGHEVEVEEAAVSSAPKAPAIFTEEDRSPEIRIEGQDEQVQMCRYCVHYIVNPFTQRCGKHEKEVSATDGCGDFTLNEDAE